MWQILFVIMALLLLVFDMLDKSKTIEKYINTVGRVVRILRKDGCEDEILAVVHSFWTSGKSRYRKQQHPIGETVDDYYSIVAPPSYDITRLCDDDTVVIDDKRFVVVNQEAIRLGRIVQYYTATLKRVWEDCDAFGR